MTALTEREGGSFAPIALLRMIMALFERIPYGLLAIVARVALAQVFWSSAQTHLANWDTTLALFSDQYQVPLLLLGLATRFAALGLFGMTMVIEIFVYPQAWPTHIQWAAMELMLVARGAGLISLDTLIGARARRWS